MKLFVILSIFGIGFVSALSQELYEWKKYHNYRRKVGQRGVTTERSEYTPSMKSLHNQHMNHHEEHLTDIPDSFEVRGENAKKDFQKYIDEIQDLAQKLNVKVTYKVTMEVTELPEQRSKQPNTKSKKYSTKRGGSNPKITRDLAAMNKHAEYSDSYMRSAIQQSRSNSNKNNQKVLQPVTTREPIMYKYKPMTSQIKLNFKKRVKPVKNSVITLNKENAN